MNYQGKTGLFVPAAIALLLLTACGGGSGGSTSSEISISFTHQTYRIAAGDSVTLTVNARGTEIGWPSAAEVGNNFIVRGNQAIYTPPSPGFPRIEQTYDFTVTAKANPLEKKTARITVYLQTAYYGINDSGQIIGEFYDIAGNRTAFLKEGNTYTRIVPNVSGNTYVYGINNYGEILGYHAVVDRYFLRGNGGIDYLSDYQGPYYTYYTGINDYENEFTGYVTDLYGYATGFIRTGNRTEWIDHPYASYRACNYVQPCGTFLTGINNYSEAVGYYYDYYGVARGFLYYNGNYYTIDPDGYPNNMADTYVWGINNYGDVVGNFHDYDGYALGFIFLRDILYYEIIIDPGAADPGYGTFVYGINYYREIVGEFDDGEKFQGFWW